MTNRTIIGKIVTGTMQRWTLQAARGFALAGLLAVPLSHTSAAQELARRLILKDGSYQAITQYEIKNGRVRYRSAERNEWEEMPSAMVDWVATGKYEKGRAAGGEIPEAAALDKELDADRQAEEDSQPTVAPGVHLPEDAGVYMLDTIDAKPQLVELHQSAGDLNRNTKRNLLRGALNPVAGSRQTIELAGLHAAVQAHAGVPAFYLKPEDDPSSAGRDAPAATATAPQTAKPQQPQQAEQAAVPFNRFFLVKAPGKGGKRTVGDIKIAVYGKVTQQQDTVKTTLTSVRGGWLKLTPVEPLAPGEYAIVEMLGHEGMNLYVWDFGVSGK